MKSPLEISSKSLFRCFSHDTTTYSYYYYRGAILEIVCRYLYYKWQYEGSTTEIPEFKVDPEVVLETLMTADFLEC